MVGISLKGPESDNIFDSVFAASLFFKFDQKFLGCLSGCGFVLKRRIGLMRQALEEALLRFLSASLQTLFMAIEFALDLGLAAVMYAIGSLRNFAGVGAGAGRLPILIYYYYLRLTSPGFLIWHL